MPAGSRPELPAVTPTAAERLWFCAWLPNLPLEAVSGLVSAEDGEAVQLTAQPAIAVVEEQHGIHRVLQADAVAAAAGVIPGQPANAALALLPGLVLEERSEACERQVLEWLAAWLERFSSFVSIAGHDAVLLELAGSLRLFGGLKNLRERISTGIRRQGVTAALAIAPTPLAATWLARNERCCCIRVRENLPRALRRLPLRCLEWPSAVCEPLTSMGVTTVGDCLRLPREGFARRFGAKLLLELDRALGVLPDPRDAWRAPERFCTDVEMTEEQSDREQLLNTCNELLLLHERFLLQRQQGTQRLFFSFFHLKKPATELRVGSAFAERSAACWFELLSLRFERLELPEPVIAIRLRGGLPQPLRTAAEGLSFGDKPGRCRHSVAQLAERLTARIGERSVDALATVLEHRPEYAWRAQVPQVDRVRDCPQTDYSGFQRPLWMLPEPSPLPSEEGCPVHAGCRLTLLDGPERLETGWWDDDGISRDYYTAVDASGTCLWVFRNRIRPSGWYLHGLFG